jgi:hypothetical protein
MRLKFAAREKAKRLAKELRRKQMSVQSFRGRVSTRAAFSTRAASPSTSKASRPC